MYRSFFDEAAFFYSTLLSVVLRNRISASRTTFRQYRSTDFSCRIATLHSWRFGRCCRHDSAAEESSSSNAAVAEDDNDDDEEDPGFCKICFYAHSEGENLIVFCDDCDLGVHQYCQEPPITQYEIDLPKWYCQDCISKRPQLAMRLRQC